jgi:hypothetical protein
MSHQARGLVAAAVLVLAGALTAPAVVGAKGFSSSSSGRSSSSYSSRSYSSKPSSSSSSKPSGGSKYANGTSRPSRPTVAKPSTGSRAQTAPVSRLVPPKPPATLTSGASRTPLFRGFSSARYDRDRSFLYRHPRYADPYFGRSYFGFYNSPFFYLWLGSTLDGDRSNNPRPPLSDTEVSPAVLSWMKAIEAQQQLARSK